jgi:hypothetical protein
MSLRADIDKVAIALVRKDAAGGFAVDASLIVADANKQRSIPGSEWNKARDPHGASRAMREYLATLDDGSAPVDPAACAVASLNAGI